MLVQERSFFRRKLHTIPPNGPALYQPVGPTTATWFAILFRQSSLVTAYGKIAFEGRSTDELNNNDLIRQFYLGM
jgi:hypothetical protein